MLIFNTHMKKGYLSARTDTTSTVSCGTPDSDKSRHLQVFEVVKGSQASFAAIRQAVLGGGSSKGDERAFLKTLIENLQCTDEYLTWLAAARKSLMPVGRRWASGCQPLDMRHKPEGLQ